MNAPTPDRYRWSYKGVTFDFYRLCEILGITHHAQAHALKKVIRAGRSIKPVTQDIDETIAALQRWKEMIGEDILSSSNSMAEAMATQYSGSEPVAGENDQTVKRAINVILETEQKRNEPKSWTCQCCKAEQNPDFYRYRVRRKDADPWIKPACAECARTMLSEGPIHTAKLES